MDTLNRSERRRTWAALCEGASCRLRRQPKVRYITKAAALRAAAWCEYLETHARRCYGLLLDDGLRAAQARSRKIEQGRLLDGFTARDVRQHQWRFLTTDEAIEAALNWLEDGYWLRPNEVGGKGPGTGRRTVRYSINPKITKIGTADGGADDQVD